MRAVNLMPSGHGRRTRESTSSLPLIAMLGGLVIVLVAGVLYVLAHNAVGSRESRLAAIQANTARWTAAAHSYDGDVATAAQRSETITQVEDLVGQRADWSKLLVQLAQLMPADSKLTTLSASGTGASSSTSSAATSSSSATSSSPASSSAAATTASSTISLGGCAASQSALAQTMTNLRRITGVSQVTLGTDNVSASSTSGGSGGCPYRITYTLSLTFVPPTFSAHASSTSADTSKTTASGVSQ